MIIKKSTVEAIYKFPHEAADKDLRRSESESEKFMTNGHSHSEDGHPVDNYDSGARIKYWGKTGAIWGGIWGLLFGLAFSMMPGIRQLLGAGPLVVGFLAGLEGAVVVGCLCALGAGFYSLGIPRNTMHTPIRVTTLQKRRDYYRGRPH